jgi:hypothetical protein
MTALHFAVSCAKPTVVRLLVDHGADIDARDDQDRTPLDIAMQMGFTSAVNLFNVVHMWTSETCAHYLPCLTSEEQIESRPFQIADWVCSYW